MFNATDPFAEMKAKAKAAEEAQKAATLARKQAQAEAMQAIDARYQLPSVAALARAEARIARSTRCCRCGASSLDGAMFTTVAGGNICDDCIG